MDVRISVIIPAYNVELYLGECIASCINQSGNYIVEIIVVDNNSTDRTWEIAQQFESQYKEKVKAIQEFKKGAGAARNAGLRIARGNWIQFLDADDLLLPAKTEHQVLLLEKCQKNPAFVAGSSIKQSVKGQRRNLILSEQSPLLMLFWGYGKCGNTCANLWNKNDLGLVGGFDEDVSSSQETRLMFNLLKKNPTVVWDKEPLTVVRARADGGQITAGKQDALTRNFFELRKEILEYIQQYDPHLLKNNRDVLPKIYRSFAIWLLSEPSSSYHIETLSFLIDHLYCPWYQRFSKDGATRYSREMIFRKWRNSRINQKLGLIK